MHPRLHSEGPRTPSKRESESLDSTVTDTAESLTSSIVFVFVLLEIHAINEVPDKNILSVYKQTINGRVILSTASKKDRQTDSIAKPIWLFTDQFNLNYFHFGCVSNVAELLTSFRFILLKIFYRCYCLLLFFLLAWCWIHPHFRNCDRLHPLYRCWFHLYLSLSIPLLSLPAEEKKNVSYWRLIHLGRRRSIYPLTSYWIPSALVQ